MAKIYMIDDSEKIFGRYVVYIDHGPDRWGGPVITTHRGTLPVGVEDLTAWIEERFSISKLCFSLPWGTLPYPIEYKAGLWSRLKFVWKHGLAMPALTAMCLYPLRNAL